MIQPKNHKDFSVHKNTPRAEILKLGNCDSGKDCQKCQQGCQQGSGCFTEEQLPIAAKFLRLDESKLKELWLEQITRFNTTLFRPKIKRAEGQHHGQCVFFDKKGGCLIHEVKPLECQISNHNEFGEALHTWFTLNHFVNPTDPQSIREWANYIESGGALIPGASLSELVPNPRTLRKIMEYKILK